MKKIILFGLIAGTSFASFAQSKIAPASALRIEATRIEAEREASSPLKAQKAAATTEAFVTLSAGATADDLRALGYEVEELTPSIVLVSIPVLQTEALAELDAVSRIEFSQPVRPLMDLARAETGVDPIQTGSVEGVTTAYRGANVIVGLFDTGIDPNHINFRDRVRGVYSASSAGKLNTYYTPEEIASFTTDSRSETHGTHVAGIMAGAYNGDGLYAFYNADNKIEVTSGAIPFYGIAPEADLLMGGGTLYTSNITKGVVAMAEDIRKSGKPGVINLSLGHNSGPHDGSDALGQTLSSVAKDAIICVSAGNEGEENISVEKKFGLSANSRKLNTFITPLVSSGSMPTSYSLSSQVEFWSNTDKAFDANIVIYDRLSDKAVYTLEVGDLGGVTKKISAADVPEFADAFDSSSYIVYTSGLNSANNRYYVLAQVVTNRNSASNTSTDIAFNLTGKNNQVVNGYLSPLSTSDSRLSHRFNDCGMDNYTTGTPDNSVNDIACGPDVICVGAYATRNNYPRLNSAAGYGWGMKVGDIAPFSSWGKVVDGRKLPVVCAPGTSVVSSVNTYYTGKSYDDCTAFVEESTRANYWEAFSGTSMSSPFMAGVIALWLDANPNLTLDEIFGIIEATSRTDSFTANEPDRWGAGKVDAIAGLREAINLSSVEGIMADSDKNLIVRTEGRAVSVYFGGAKSLDVALLNVAGTEVARVRANADSATLDASHLSPGIYMVAIQSGNNRLARKIAIR